MVLTILMWIGLVIVGLCTVCLAAFAFVFFVSKTAVEFAQHPVNCPCSKCQDRRLKEYRAGVRPSGPLNQPRRADDRDVKPGRAGSNWKATTQLRVGMYVSGKDNSKTYRVTRMERSLAGVVVVHLVNISTRRPSSIPVTSDQVDKPIWLVIADEGEWD